MRSPEVIRELLVLNLNQLADVMESKAKAYRAVASDLMNGTGHEAPKRKKKSHGLKGRKYNGTHWTQLPKNRARLLAMARKGAAKRYGK